MLPTLQILERQQQETRISGLEDEIVKTLRISSQDRARLLPGGGQSALSNRLGFARSYLKKAGLIDEPRRGYVRASERGRELMREPAPKIDLAVLQRYPEFNAAPGAAKAVPERTPGSADERPAKDIGASFDALNAELSREIIERVHGLSPAFFERLIVDLLVRMGYGGGRLEMGRALGRSGDGGVDGVIKEDELGLDVVYVQAKRLDPNNGVPVREVRDFVGALEGHRASKGVFVTTSYFPASAYEFVTRVSKRVVLIDGPELAKLMIRHRVGVRVKDVYEVKKIDEDYFVE